MDCSYRPSPRDPLVQEKVPTFLFDAMEMEQEESGIDQQPISSLNSKMNHCI